MNRVVARNEKERGYGVLTRTYMPKGLAAYIARELLT